MQLTFEHSQKIADGSNPAGYHTPDSRFQVMFTEGGKVKTTTTTTPTGYFADRTFSTPYAIATDEEVEFLRVTYLPRVNLLAHWESEDRHRLTVLILKQDASQYLESGTIQYRDQDPGATMTLTLQNPEGLFAAEGYAGVMPGGKISVWFSMGDSEMIQIGLFFVDRISKEVGKPTVTIEARNTTGKLLKDQTFNTSAKRMSWKTDQFFGEMLVDAGISEYAIQEELRPSVYEFTPDKTYYEGMMDALLPLFDWRIREDETGRIIIGHRSDFEEFTEGVFSFDRDTDCISRQIVRDDQNTYSKIAVWYTEEGEAWTTATPVSLSQQSCGYGDGTKTSFLPLDYVFSPVIPGQAAGLQMIVPLGSPARVYIDGHPIDEEGYTFTPGGSVEGMKLEIHTAPLPGEHVTLDYQVMPYRVSEPHILVPPLIADDTVEVRFPMPRQPIVDPGQIRVMMKYKHYIQESLTWVNPYRETESYMELASPWSTNTSVETNIKVIFEEDREEGSTRPSYDRATGELILRLPPMWEDPHNYWYLHWIEATEIKITYAIGDVGFRSEFKEYANRYYTYKNVEFPPGWNMPRNKTLFVELANGTTQEEAEEIAEELASRLAEVGVTETFLSPIRPQLQPGDAAEITQGASTKTLGTVTDVEHRFGTGGFYTQFTVDSGGMLGKPLIKDFIQNIAQRLKIPRGKYEDLT